MRYLASGTLLIYSSKEVYMQSLSRTVFAIWQSL